MALTSRNPRALTIVVETSIMLIFCFAGCAAGSCINYGHSCWGAHGKRSDVQDASSLRILAIKALLSGYPQNATPSPKVQWLLSRLISGQPVLPLTDKYHVRWSSFPKDRNYVPPKWEYDVTPTDDDSIKPIRVPINNENENSERKIGNAQGIMHSMNGKTENTPDILLVSPDEYDKPINDLQKLDILKFLSERNGNTK